jgi:hypothetical protein
VQKHFYWVRILLSHQHLQREGIRKQILVTNLSRQFN